MSVRAATADGPHDVGSEFGLEAAVDSKCSLSVTWGTVKIMGRYVIVAQLPKR
ncbi:hypothetical protein GCM10023190_18320 [Enteractinococcus fodinae]